MTPGIVPNGSWCSPSAAIGEVKLDHGFPIYNWRRKLQDLDNGEHVDVDVDDHARSSIAWSRLLDDFSCNLSRHVRQFKVCSFGCLIIVKLGVVREAEADWALKISQPADLMADLVAAH